MGTGLLQDSESAECPELRTTDMAVDGGSDNEAVAKKLPPKKETIIWLLPSSEQVQAYKKVLEKSEVIREACQKQKLGIEVFRAIGLLKRLCNHPSLLLPTTKTGAWAELLASAVEDQDTGSGHDEGAVEL